MGNGQAKIGHVHLKVRNIDTSVAFYRSVLGFQVTEEIQPHFAFLSGGSMHHELALQQSNHTQSKPGLYHVAFEVENEEAFWSRFDWLKQQGYSPMAVDHGISYAMYFNDPDGHGVEIYTDMRHRGAEFSSWKGASQHLKRPPEH